MENQDKKKILNKIVEDFKTVGFSKEQILKLLNVRQKEKGESLICPPLRSGTATTCIAW